MRNSCIYKISGTKTFRLSSVSILDKFGGNLQNIEKSLRRIYIPDPGKIFVQVDQSGAEALIVAYCCRDANYRSLFKNGIKPHSYLATHLFKAVWPRKMQEIGQEIDMDEVCSTPIPELKKNPNWSALAKLIKSSDDWPYNERYYYLAKQTEHSSNYDIQPPTFRMNVLEKSGGKIVISKDDSEQFLKVKHSLYPEIKEDYHTMVRRQVTDCGMLFNLQGHPYTVTDYSIDEKDWKDYYAWIAQSTVGEITNTAAVNFQDYIEQHDLAWDLLANTHDSFMSQCPINEYLECAFTMQQFMNQKLVSPFDGVEFQMQSEAVAGYNWAPYHPNKNPQGLREIE